MENMLLHGKPQALCCAISLGDTAHYSHQGHGKKMPAILLMLPRVPQLKPSSDLQAQQDFIQQAVTGHSGKLLIAIMAIKI